MYSGEHEDNPDEDRPFDWELDMPLEERGYYTKRAVDENDQGDLHPDATNGEVEAPELEELDG